MIAFPFLGSRLLWGLALHDLEADNNDMLPLWWMTDCSCQGHCVNLVWHRKVHGKLLWAEGAFAGHGLYAKAVILLTEGALGPTKGPEPLPVGRLVQAPGTSSCGRC